jgi:hypothetical protein
MTTDGVQGNARLLLAARKTAAAGTKATSLFSNRHATPASSRDPSVHRSPVSALAQPFVFDHIALQQPHQPNFRCKTIDYTDGGHPVNRNRGVHPASLVKILTLTDHGSSIYIGYHSQSLCPAAVFQKSTE